MKGFLVAGTDSGCGKTTVAIGLMALFRRRGWKVAPFKSGPDFIDPMFHEAATGTASYNLDSYLLGDDALRRLCAKHAADRDITIVEGAMGLFDGLGPESLGSAAELAGKLGLPVILVVSCKALHQSAAAMVAGYNALLPGGLRGVILNHVHGMEQYRQLKDLVERKTGVPCLGHLPPEARLELGSRHLGLLQAEEVGDLQGKLDRLARLLEEGCDLPALEAMADGFAPPAPVSAPDFGARLDGLRLGVAQDAAFRFYYRDNLELLQGLGAELAPFSPLADARLPARVDALYVGGGYPEVHAERLAANASLRREIRERVGQGFPVFAECGGLMYLTEAIVADGREFPMAGVFNCRAHMTKRLQRFGYAELEFEGAHTRCHEFHHSQLEPSSVPPNHQLQYRLRKPESGREWACGLRRNNCLAGYAHVHFHSSPEFFKRLAALWTQAG